MADYAVKRIDEMDAALYGSFKRARAELGVASFGMQVIDLPASFDGYPSHDHSHDDQEEVYLALRGTGELEVDGERMPLDPDHIARVGPAEQRKVWVGPEGMRLLVLGGVPGRAYTAPAPSEIGGPDPKMV
ncbi:MAG: cupin domain-containing protein [Actinobacteria bacterium]|nr:cupin domain-containing protein [Actinomycetota bacterium]